MVPDDKFYFLSHSHRGESFALIRHVDGPLPDKLPRKALGSLVPRKKSRRCEVTVEQIPDLLRLYQSAFPNNFTALDTAEIEEVAGMRYQLVIHYKHPQSF